jgi:hypothetical protein
LYRLASIVRNHSYPCWQNSRDRPSKDERQINGIQPERARRNNRSCPVTSRRIEAVNDNDKVPAPVISAEPDKELEQKLKRDPSDQDAKVDVGSDESMDASDPSAAAQPGSCDEPVPSSGFPE